MHKFEREKDRKLMINKLTTFSQGKGIVDDDLKQTFINRSIGNYCPYKVEFESCINNKSSKTI